ncbi:M20/M25/M40 family metallo-hydrolase [Oceaniglobus trochenteri]|uniref:M20/M25/M40 family metallo-hydrolase n=1 Tax=Oceaniglobus trochenteri TaxID=2763260 RepID=UPI001CFF9BD2|nr:M20/M25/M40 family metallo-hydrolase [Oceaniglobus trochenteri]
MAEGTDALDFLQRLVVAQAKGEAAVQDVIAEALSAAGCTFQSHSYLPADVPVTGEFAVAENADPHERTAIVGTLPGTDPACRSLLMFAHPDGEPAHDTSRWTHPPFQTTRIDGRIHGWGVADDLAGCAAAVLAIRHLAQTPGPRGDLIFASTPSKRHARGVAALLHRGVRADAALYLHPAESGRGMAEIKAVTCGHLEFRVTVCGRAPDTHEPSHTAFSHLAVNPVDKAVILHAALMALAEDRAERIRHPLIEAEVGRASNLHVAAIQAGTMGALSRLAPECALGCALSFPPGESPDTLRREVETALARAAQADPWMADHPPQIDWLSGVTGAEVSRDHPLWKVASGVVGRATGAEPVVNPMHTASDIRVPMIEAGIPCVGFGCLAGDLTHSGRHDEWVDAADYLRMVDVTAAIAADWCAGARE